MNQFCLVGRVARIPVLQEHESGWKSCQLLLSVERPYANSQGLFESDEIEVVVWRGAAETLAAVAALNSWVSVKGRIQSRCVQKEGRQWINYSFIAEKVEYIH